MSQFSSYPKIPGSTTPIQYQLDGLPQIIIQDTVTPANSRAMPVSVLNSGGTITNFALDSTLGTMSAKLPATLGQKAMAGSMSVALSSDQSAIPVNQNGAWSVAVSNFPATQTIAGSVSVSNFPATQTIAGSVSVSNFPATQAVSGTVTVSNFPAFPATQAVSGTVTISNFPATQTVAGTVAVSSVGGTVAISAASLPLPAGAATSANQTALQALFPSSIGQKTMAGSMSVALASDQSVLPIKTQGKTVVGFARNDYTVTNVTTAAYTQLVASTASLVTEIEIFDSSGNTLYLATGGVGGETNLMLITPGGNGRVPVSIPAGTRISVRAVATNATAGEIDLNLYG